MTNQKTNPKVEWGFYAITPRIVRTHYKDCSHAEKWLYTCLKDLCGDKGTCFRSLRSLSEETGISIASLSTMIPHLHAVGLIHAEKKSRGRGGKEVWHISIVDIWQANKEYCSKNEQVPDGDVQNLNNNVQNLNEVSESCSEFERSCSNFSDRRITLKNNITEERTIEEESNSESTDTHTFVSSDTARAEYPLITFADCLTYLQEQGVAPRGEDAVEVMVQARTLYAHKRPRYEYRARPGLSEHPDDQLPGKTEAFIEKLREWRSEDEQVAPSQDEQVFTDEPPQGDDHAVPASGHSHRLGDAAARGDDTSHGSVAAGQVATPEDRPVLEARQEIDNEGDTQHAYRVPTIPAANTPASVERAVSRPGSEHSDYGAHPDNGLPVVRAVGSVTTSSNGNQDTEPQGVDGRDAAQTLAETPTTPMPAQSLSPFPQAEQAALGAKQEPKLLAEPDMSGKWSHEKCVEYAEWCNQRRYTEKMHEEQLKAAHAIHKNDVALTLEQFKQAYDERNDAWWKEHRGKLHVNDMKARGSSGIDRVHEMLQRIEDSASRSRTQPRLQLVSSAPPANAFIARSLDKEYNQRKLAEMRAEVARQQAQQIGV